MCTFNSFNQYLKRSSWQVQYSDAKYLITVTNQVVRIFLKFNLLNFDFHRKPWKWLHVTAWSDNCLSQALQAEFIHRHFCIQYQIISLFSYFIPFKNILFQAPHKYGFNIVYYSSTGSRSNNNLTSLSKDKIIGVCVNTIQSLPTHWL